MRFPRDSLGNDVFGIEFTTCFLGKSEKIGKNVQNLHIFGIRGPGTPDFDPLRDRSGDPPLPGPPIPVPGTSGTPFRTSGTPFRTSGTPFRGSGDRFRGSGDRFRGVPGGPSKSGDLETRSDTFPTTFSIKKNFCQKFFVKKKYFFFLTKKKIFFPTKNFFDTKKMLCHQKKIFFPDVFST